MSLESATKVSELVATNPTGTDPKSQGDDHLRMIKLVLQNNAIKSEIGQSATPANNFSLDASADNGTMKLAREGGQEIMTVGADGKVAFPQLPKSLNGNGYFTLPGGLIVQWGFENSGAAGNRTITLPIPFPNAFLQFCATADGAGDMSTQLRSVSVDAVTNSNFVAKVNFVNNGGVVGFSNAAIRWIAVGY